VGAEKREKEKTYPQKKKWGGERIRRGERKQGRDKWLKQTRGVIKEEMTTSTLLIKRNALQRQVRFQSPAFASVRY